MEILAYVLRYGFVVVLAVAFVLIGLAIVRLAREKARADTETPSPSAEE